MSDNEEPSAASGGFAILANGVDSMVNMASNRRAFDSGSGTTLTDRPVCDLSLVDAIRYSFQPHNARDHQRLGEDDE